MKRLYKISLLVLINLIFTNCLFAANIEAPQKKLKAVHPLLPNTTAEYLKPCSLYVDEQLEMDTALTCGNNNAFTNKQEQVLLPRCFVISKNSPDLIKTEDEHLALPMNPFQDSAAVGFFDINDNLTIYLVENPELDFIFRHELGHYLMLILDGDIDQNHVGPFWKFCSTQTFDPSNLTPEGDSK